MNTVDDIEPIEALRERLRQLQTAIDVTGLGLWEWDVRAGTLVWNARNRELFGLTHDRPLTIQDYAPLVHAEDRDLVTAAYRAESQKPDGGDFVVEHRTAFQPDGKVRWVQARGRVIKDVQGVLRVVGSTLDITDRKTAEDRRSLVLNELAHRAKNGILVMMTFVAQTAKSALSVEHFEELLTARLRAMAESQDLVTQSAGRPLALTDLLTRALNLFDTRRFDIAPELAGIRIPSEMVVALALLLHELSTNAVKYGALSAPAGRVRLALGAADLGHAMMVWTETGGPAVSAPSRRGFGTRLLDISLRNNGGRVEARFDPRGFQADIHMPVGDD